MSALSSRRVVTSGSLSLALALATPLAAFADTGAPAHSGERGSSASASASHGQSASSSKGSSSSAGASKGSSASASHGSSAQARADKGAPAAGRGTSTSARAAQGEPASGSERQSAPAGRSKAADRPAKGKGGTAVSAAKSTGKRAEKSAAKSPADSAPAGKGATAKGASDEGRAAGGDPRGNNGTVKIDGAVVDDGGRGNEPHIPCADFELDYYGFDEGDLADVMLTAHAPTKGGALWSRDDALISSDAAGGGQDADEELTVLISDLAGLSSLTPHPKQGYHVKLTSDTTTAPGGAKQKVFWIEPCAAEETATETVESPAQGEGGGAVETPAQGEGGGAVETPAEGEGGGTVETPTTTSGEVVATPVSGGTQEAATGAVEALAPTFGSGTATVTGTTIAGTTAATAAGAGAATASAGRATVSARAAAGPSTLPFTGGQELGLVLASGLVAIGLGGLAHRLGRKGAHGLR